MAISIGKVNVDNRSHVLGNRRQIVLDATLDNSYPAGGYPLTPAQLGVDGALDYVIAQPTTTGHMLVYDYAAQKMRVFSAGAEITAATNLSTVVIRLVAQGKGVPTF